MAQKTGELHLLVVNIEFPGCLAEEKNEVTAQVVELGRLRELA